MWGNRELVETIKKVNATGGLNLDMESICNYQDAIGHSTLEELHELATDKQTSEAFYRIYQAAAGTINTLRFYFENSNAVQELRERAEDAETRNKQLESSLAAVHESNQEALDLYYTADAQRKSHVQRVKQLEEENIRLKAKLYDLMNK